MKGRLVSGDALRDRGRDWRLVQLLRGVAQGEDLPPPGEVAVRVGLMRGATVPEALRRLREVLQRLEAQGVLRWVMQERARRLEWMVVLREPERVLTSAGVPVFWRMTGGAR